MHMIASFAATPRCGPICSTAIFTGLGFARTNPSIRYPYDNGRGKRQVALESSRASQVRTFGSRLFPLISPFLCQSIISLTHKEHGVTHTSIQRRRTLRAGTGNWILSAALRYNPRHIGLFLVFVSFRFSGLAWIGLLDIPPLLAWSTHPFDLAVLVVLVLFSPFILLSTIS